MKEPQVLRSRKHSKHSSLHKIKILCSFNGAFVRRSNSDRVRYVGGETKIIKVDRDSGISNLLSKTCEFFPDPKPSHLDVAFRYHVPASNVDDNKWNLVSITTDDDVRAMVREYDNLMIRNKMSKIRLFVFDVRSCKYLNLDSFSFPRFEIIGNLNMVERLNQEFSEAHLNRERKGGTFHSPMASQASRFQKSYDQLQSTKEGYLTYVAHIKNSGLKSQYGSYRNQFITSTPEILTNNHRFEGNNLCKNTNSKIRTIAVRNANPIDMRNHLRNDVLNVPKIHRIFKTDGKSNILLDPVPLGDQLSFSETIYDLPNIDYDPRCNSFSPQSSSKATENTNLDGHGYPLIDLGPKESNISTVKYNERKQEVESQVYQLNLKDDEQNILKSSKEKFSAIDSSNIVFSLWSASTIDGSGSKVSPESLPKYPDGSSKDITCVVSQKEKANRDTDKICSIEVDKANRQLMTIFTHLASQELQIIKNEDIEEIRRLGSGTYGTVFYGKWKGSDVAVKRIKPRCFTGSELEKEKLIANFWKEARLLAQLHHPNVLAFYGVITNGPGQTLATVSEFMVNGSLKQVLSRKDRTIDRRKRVIIATDAAIAMEYLHEKNVVHFDLKSGNLLMNMRDPLHPVCKIGDLGLSKVKQKTLISGGFRGTLPWMAPELLHETNMVTEKVDVYSFGIVMWELLTGEEPYANMQSEEILAGILKGNLRPEIPCWCDPSWRSLMKRCWSSDPNLRPSFQDIAKELLSMSSSMNIKY